MAQSLKDSQWQQLASLSSKVQPPSMKTVQPIQPQPPAYTASTSSLYSLNLQLDNRGESSHRCWTASRGDSQTTRAIILTDPMSLLPKVKSGVGNPDWHTCIKTLWMCFHRYAGVKGNDQADSVAGKATITSVLCLGRSEVFLRSLRH